MQFEYAHAIKMNYDIHLAKNPVLDKGSLEKYGCRIQCYG